MKKWINVALILAAVSLFVGLISRLLLTWTPFGLVARSYLGFSECCLLFAIALGIRELLKKQ